MGTYDARMYEGPGCNGTEYNCIDCFTITDTSCLTALIVTNNGSSGSGSLRRAFDCALTGDTIKFDPSLRNTTIFLNLPEISNDQSLALFSNLADNISISSVQLLGNNQSFISTSAPLSISGLKLEGNGPEPLLFEVNSGGNIEIVDCELKGVTIYKN